MNTKSYVYFILDIGHDAIKIGKANDIDVRLSDLQVGNPIELVVLHYFECKSSDHALFLENHYHQMFDKLHIRGEWFRYKKELFSKFFINEINFEPKSKRSALTTSTLFGEEILFDVKKHPRCYFYTQYVAQIKESYENSQKLTLPFRTMEYPTHGKKLLLPHSHKTDRVFISTKKHEQNLELKRFESNKLNEVPTENTIESFITS
jgi:hypothetical protein